MKKGLCYIGIICFSIIILLDSWLFFSGEDVNGNAMTSSELESLQSSILFKVVIVAILFFTVRYFNKKTKKEVLDEHKVDSLENQE